MYEVRQVDYHYYWELSEGLDKLLEEEKLETISVISIGSSGDMTKMHRATVLCKLQNTVVSVREVSEAIVKVKEKSEL